MLRGGAGPRGAKFRAPGPVHHARWLNKLFNALKIRMFRKQFSFIAQDEEALKELSVFAIQVNIEAWFTAPEAIKAPFRDLALLKSLLQHFNTAVFFATSEKMTENQWYLSEELVAHSFFDMMLYLLKQSSTWLPSFKTKIMMNKIL